MSGNVGSCSDLLNVVITYILVEICPHTHTPEASRVFSIGNMQCAVPQDNCA